MTRELTPQEGIVWLASYPKSGNTWLRMFLTNLLSDTETPARPNDIWFWIASCRRLFEQYAGVCSHDLVDEEIRKIRPRVYERLLATADEFPVFIKIHDALHDHQSAIVSKASTAGAIYIIRNPLDIAVSFTHHSRQGKLDRVIASLSDPEHSIRGRFQLEQRLQGWSHHVSSWVDSGMNICVIRYEDMLDEPQATFTRAMRFAGLEHSDAEIQRALECCDFRNLQAMERQHGFNEQQNQNSLFFRSGKSGQWRQALNAKQVDAIVKSNASVMHQFGYLDDV